MAVTYGDETVHTYTLTCENCSCEEKLYDEKDFPSFYSSWKAIKFQSDSIIFNTNIGNGDILMCPDCSEMLIRIYDRLEGVNLAT